MAAITVQKKKCTFWDKCYRKNKKHLEEFLHPGDSDDEMKGLPGKTKKQEHTDDDTTSKPRLVHDISMTDDDDAVPAWKTAKARRKRKSNEEDETNAGPQSSTLSDSSPPKKMKIDEENVEKITVDYSKPKKSKASEANKPSTSAPSKVIQYTAKKEKCKYWDKCYQKNGDHLKEYYHPNDTILNDDEKEKRVRGQKGPINAFDDGTQVNFNTGFVLKRQGDIYSCSCDGFTGQSESEEKRTCKHLKEYLGEEYEKMRVRKQPIPSHTTINVLLAKKYEEKVHNPIGWWISEKLDGVRGYWNGRCFYSRLGNAFYAPEWFTKDLPKDIHLDGELFGGRGQFQSTVSIVKTAESPKWKDIKYYVFDSPRMGKDPFEKRMNTIKEYFEDVQPKYAVFVEQTKCVSKEQLDKMLTRTLNLGGEGLMIREPKSVYEGTRSSTLLKIKKFYDAEAIVIGHEKGKGVNAFRCGALRCRMACGKEFSVGSGLTDKDRNKPPKIGSIITYKFQELSKNGSPRFPTYVGIRIDMNEPKDAEIRPVLDEDEA